MRRCQPMWALLVTVAALVALLFSVVKASATSPVARWPYYWAEVGFQVVGTGNYVNSWGFWATNETWPGTLYIERRVVGPNGMASPWKLYGVPYSAGQSWTTMSIAQNYPMVPGTYCGQFEIYGKPITQHCWGVS